jgi:hypothetical protein
VVRYDLDEDELAHCNVLPPPLLAVDAVAAVWALTRYRLQSNLFQQMAMLAQDC